MYMCFPADNHWRSLSKKNFYALYFVCTQFAKFKKVLFTTKSSIEAWTLTIRKIQSKTGERPNGTKSTLVI